MPTQWCKKLNYSIRVTNNFTSAPKSRLIARSPGRSWCFLMHFLAFSRPPLAFFRDAYLLLALLFVQRPPYGLGNATSIFVYILYTSSSLYNIDYNNTQAHYILYTDWLSKWVEERTYVIAFFPLAFSSVVLVVPKSGGKGPLNLGLRELFYWHLCLKLLLYCCY